MTGSQFQQEIRYPPLFRLVNGVGILVLLFIAFSGWMAHPPAMSKMVVWMDSNQGTIQKIVINENGRWLDVTQHITSMAPHFQF